MKRKLAIFILLIWMLPVCAWAADYLVPVGTLVGLQLRTDTITVAAFDEASGSAARDAGLKIGDCITAVNGTPAQSIDQIKDLLQKCTAPVVLSVTRGSRRLTLHLTPRQTESGAVLGVYLRQGISGIGTVTWYDPETKQFAALGHGVSTGKEGLFRLVSGEIYPAEVYSVQKGKSGQPGLLKGQALSHAPIGALSANTPRGIFGTTSTGFSGSAVPVGQWDALHTGPATILATVRQGPPQEYSVEILKIYPKDRTTHRNFLLKVTDPSLINQTGGIVQGMSGSPILQDGKLIGAVTHVLVNDPTCGYGIFIENMLEAAG